MKTISLETAEGRCIARDVRIADTLVARGIGLLRDKSLTEQQGLLLIPGGSIHTFWMQFPIDIVFLDHRMRVLNLAPNVAPGRFRVAPPGTRRVLELAAGRIAAVGLLIGACIFVEQEARADAGAGMARRERSHAPLRATCTRPPIQFSLRLPPQHRGSVRSNLACGPGHTGVSAGNKDAAPL